MKGIILAGGSGSRLWPSTSIISKQLLPIYDKPMIYYPLSTLMLAGVKEILIITSPRDHDSFVNLLGSGSSLGITLHFAIQEKPRGIAEAFIIGNNFLNNESCLLILGDNVFYGAGFGMQLQNSLPDNGAHIFTYEVSDPSSYGVLNLDSKKNPLSVIEKPIESKSKLAITGLYYFDYKAVQFANAISPSARGELEITAVIDRYLEAGELSFTHLSRGIAWLDTGSPQSLHEAASFIRVVEERTGLKIACLEEIAYRMGYISIEELIARVEGLPISEYKSYLLRFINDINNE